jgi:hypothetical protein
MGILLNDGQVTFGTTAGGAPQVGFLNATPVGAKAAPAALGPLKAGAAGTETAGEFKALYELVVELRARLKELGLWT